ncbi:hypothetical protein [Streptomyces sp. A30]|uniref:hypothetical protein n=1 Tax=Streptomyces sp. A30 TaxID=2789273 RepID=UPI003980B31B
MTGAASRAAPVRGAVGAPHTRVDGRDKVTGAARYAAEIPFAELAHGWLVLSTVVRTSAARRRLLRITSGHLPFLWTERE